ncbi:MAG: BA14K family protein [Rhizobium altiplani]|jgi:hypothetical protein|uniref:BA14K family protein n=1 Tax=Rhizobium altiplani TaxID=1864509 RepID=UPI000DD9F9AA
MRAIATMLFGIASAVGACFIGAAAATYILAVPDGRQFANLDTPNLWTASPERVDARSQKFERIAPLVSAAYPVTSAAPEPKADVVANSASEDSSTDAASASLRNEHQQWCASRYRSYDRARDTYRSYSGQIRICVSPFAAPSMEITGSVSGNPDQLAWCFARYASYRANDNTYQPYGRPRRECVSPFSSNTSAETASQ